MGGQPLHDDSSSRARGFTLLEILVVVVIVAVLSGFVLLSFNTQSKEDQLASDAERLAAQLTQFCREALLSARPLGVALTPTDYQFLQLVNDQWVNMNQQSSWHDRRFSSQWQLSIDSRPLTEKQDTPNLVCLSTGDWIPFTLDLTYQAQRIEMFSGSAGQVVIAP